MNDLLYICELFKSIQGESTHAGSICAFVRLAGCNLSCSYCDTKYAAAGGRAMTIDSIVAAVNKYDCSLVEITGGEPLMQNATPLLADQLLAGGKTVLIETNGSFDIGVLPQGCIRIIDVKCPGSAMGGSFLMQNIEHLTKRDEMKFVLGSYEDFDWALTFIKDHRLHEKATLLFSPVTGTIVPADCAQWILDTNAPVRLQLQLHKMLWGDKRGV
jgi:7-carboxy-7-deazaguanine synthase